MLADVCVGYVVKIFVAVFATNAWSGVTIDTASGDVTIDILSSFSVELLVRILVAVMATL